MSTAQSFDDRSLWQLECNEQDRITAEVALIYDRRAVIETSQGHADAAHGIDGDQAFKLLKWQSQENNVTLRDLAAQVVSDFQAVTNGDVSPTVVYDHLFLSAHTGSFAKY